MISIDSNAFFGTAWYNNQPDGVVYAGKVAYVYKGTMPENTDIVIQDGTLSISPQSFSECSGLTSIEIPNSVKNIGDYAFEKCTGLTSIVIPNSVTILGNWVFQGCSNITSIAISNSISRISIGTFNGCTGLTSFVIPNSVTTIDSYAFYNCVGLTSIVLPNSISSIGGLAFQDCTGLTTITSLNPIPPTCTGGDSFRNVDHTIPVYVPQGSVLNYKAADIWRNFVVFREIGGDADGVLLTIKDGGNGKTQLLVDESKPYFTLFFKADSGWKLHSVTFNGDDVTPEVGSDGNYTTSALTSSSTINVVYQQTSQSINAVSNSSVQVKACNGEIVISSDDSSAIPVIIYNIDGKVVGRETIMGGEAHITLPIENIYVIKAGGQTFKVSL